MPPEVYVSTEAVVEARDPITDELLHTVTFRRALDIAFRPQAARRAFAKSGAQSNKRLRSVATITIRKDEDTLELFKLLEKWAKGVTHYPLTSDLKGKRYHGVTLRLKQTNGDGSSVAHITAYNCQLGERSISVPDGGVVVEAFTIECLGGLDDSTVETGEPYRALSLFRTGDATYVATDGTIKTAGDGVARMGLSSIRARNLLLNSDFRGGLTGWSLTNSATGSVHFSPSGIPGGYPSYVLDGHSNVAKLTIASGQFAGNWQQSMKAIASVQYRLSAWFYVPSSVSGNPKVWFGSTAYGVFASTSITERDVWVQKSVAWTPSSDTDAYALLGSNGGNAAGDYFYMAAPQLEVDAAAGPSTYQPTSASGLNLANPRNGIGFILEGSSTNLLLHSQDFTNAVWQTSAPGSLSSTSGATDPAGTATAATFDLTVSGSNFFQTLSTAWGTNTFTGAIWLKGAVGGERVQLQLQESSGGTNIATKNAMLAPYWARYEVMGTGTGAGDVRFRVVRNGGIGTAYVAFAQVEPLAFATGYIVTTSATASRSADTCAPALPHNLLKHSQDFSQSAWTRTGVLTTSATGVFGTATAAQADLTVGGAGVSQTTSVAFNGQPRTMSVWLKGNAGGEQVTLTFQRSDTLANVTNTTVTLTSGWRRYMLTTTSTVAGVNIVAKVARSSTTGSYFIDAFQLVEGSHPGPYVRTTDTALAKPAIDLIDPAWAQNGFVEFDMVAGPTSPPNLTQVDLFGSTKLSGSAAILRLVRRNSTSSSSHSILFDRAHNGLTGTGGTAGRAYVETLSGTTLFDGGRHTIRLEWQNYILSGVRYMPLRIYVDGSKIAEIDASSLYGATSWATPERQWASDGVQYSTISALETGYLIPPDGAIPAA